MEARLGKASEARPRAAEWAEAVPSDAAPREEGPVEGQRVGEVGRSTVAPTRSGEEGCIGVDDVPMGLAGVEEPEDGGEDLAAQTAGRQAGGPRVAVGLGHKLVRTGAVLWCHKCGAHAEARVGSALSGGCRPVLEAEKSGRASRRRLLLQGRHPVTRQPLRTKEEEDLKRSEER